MTTPQAELPAKDIVEAKIEYPAINATNTPIGGFASWYDYKLKGEPKYSEKNSTCASRDFQRGTILQITNTKTGDAVNCRVNDFVENPGVIVDLSSFAFSKIAKHYLGVVPVEVENIGCSCIKTARHFGAKIDWGVNAKDLKPNSTPEIGALALFAYEGIDHVALITKIEANGFWVKEGNFKECEIGERFVWWIDPFIRGFYVVGR